MSGRGSCSIPPLCWLLMSVSLQCLASSIPPAPRRHLPISRCSCQLFVLWVRLWLLCCLSTKVKTIRLPKAGYAIFFFS
ncbi:hypothetical protein EV702DRAFT_626924 [Suillus placidus]|uniref:Secreted protein n=1 Tax=Suillus placidus TaxID=48579 RepID=A0A9P7CY45_9AGAM|nr:hypothetical protein EV702DRAFT_626924 [Suillus placidus]